MEEPYLSEKQFGQFRTLAYELTGITWNDSKRQMVQSRLQKRLRHHKLDRFEDYYALLTRNGRGQEQNAEIGAFVNCITTNKTDFFREPHHFEFVSSHVLPEWRQRVERGEADRMLRVWHAGCSTGEEPYTLAMTLAEVFRGRNEGDFRQLASDIDTSVLAHATRGVYERERVAPVPLPLLHRYFLRGTGENADYVQARRELREHITFRQINLLAEPWPMHPDTRFDIIFCRNVIIYFDKPTQRRLFARFQQVLRPGGCLFIGHSESLVGVSDAFAPAGATIYRLPENAGAEAHGAVKARAA